MTANSVAILRVLRDPHTNTTIRVMQDQEGRGLAARLLTLEISDVSVFTGQTPADAVRAACTQQLDLVGPLSERWLRAQIVVVETWPSGVPPVAEAPALTGPVICQIVDPYRAEAGRWLGISHRGGYSLTNNPGHIGVCSAQAFSRRSTFTPRWLLVRPAAEVLAELQQQVDDLARRIAAHQDGPA